MASARVLANFCPKMIKSKTLQDLFQRYRRPGDLIFAIVFLAISVFLLFALPYQTKWSGSGSIFAKPAFYVYASVYMMVGFGALHVFSAAISAPSNGRWREVLFWIKSLEYAGWFLVYVWLAPLLGYLLATVLFSVSLTYRLGYRGTKALGSAALFAVAVVLLFKTFLRVKLPGGAIYEFLPTAARSFMLTYF